MRDLVAFIPAPGDWGKTYRLYGVMIAFGVLAGLELGRRRWQALGGDPEDMSTIVLWGTPAGLIGARLYHVITDRETYAGHWFDSPFDPNGVSPLAIQRGGLGIPGGIVVGVLVGGYIAKRKGLRLPPVLDVVAVGIPLAQAIGRWGNYFNQELFGRPSELPWALEVDPEHRGKLLEFATFHPTFLYEMLWNLALVGFLIWIYKKKILRPGNLFALYLGGYFLGRLWVEALRSDEAKTIIAGLRINIWISLLAIVAVTIWFAVHGLRRRPGDNDEPYADGHRWDSEVGIVRPEPGPDDSAVLGPDDSVVLGPDDSAVSGPDDSVVLGPDDSAVSGPDDSAVGVTESGQRVAGREEGDEP